MAAAGAFRALTLRWGGCQLGVREELRAPSPLYQPPALVVQQAMLWRAGYGEISVKPAARLERRRANVLRPKGYEM